MTKADIGDEALEKFLESTKSFAKDANEIPEGLINYYAKNADKADDIVNLINKHGKKVQIISLSMVTML